MFSNQGHAEPMKICRTTNRKSDQILLIDRLLILIFSLKSLIIIVQPSSSQFIAHINQQGFRGNITFDVRKSLDNIDQRENGSSLFIEALVEADKWRFVQDDQNVEEIDSQQPIEFEWTLHSNSLEPHQLDKCLNDHLGPVANDDLLKQLPENRNIQLDKLKRWSIFVNQTTRELSALIWSKSIRIKLAKWHEDKASAGARPKQKQNDTPSSGSSDKPKAIAVKPQLSRPQLTFSSRPSVAVPTLNKPTFAPRPKPNISAKFNRTNTIQSGIRTRRQIDAQKTDPVTTTTAPSRKHDNILVATNRRIVRLYGHQILCGNIIDTRNVKTVQAVFESQSVAGRVTIRGNEDDISLITANLYHIRSKVTTRHDWKIMASDILDTRRSEDRCKYLSLVLDPNNLSAERQQACNRTSAHMCRIGDLGKKHGHLQVTGQGRSARNQMVDLNLPLAALDGTSSRPLFLVIFEVAAKTASTSNGTPQVMRQNILSCATLNSVQTRKLEAHINMDGVRGSVKFSQRHPSEPTSITYDLFGLEGNFKHVNIMELPVPIWRPSSIDSTTLAIFDNKRLCSQLGQTFQGQTGNLSSRHGHLIAIDSDYEDHYMGEMLDLNLQLFGTQTITGRSLSINKNNGDPWVCATLELADDEPMHMAVAKFHYPVVGTVMFAQPAGDPLAPTGVLVELYNPNGDKDTGGHNWLIHMRPAMADFYNWSQRCESTGEVFDPIQASVGLNNDAYSRHCLAGLLDEPLRCRLGDTSLKSNIKLMLPILPQDRIRYYYIDPYLPLSGPNSILARSMVIYDEMVPAQRGNRLACSTIKTLHPLRAAIKSWDSGPSIPSDVRGSIILEQEAPSKHTRAKLDLTGFNGNVENYAIHHVWVTDDREFPCSNDSLYDIYDPFKNELFSHLPPSAHYGSSATVDRVKVGDLSRKHGSLEGLQTVQKQFRDSNLPLFAPYSIIGRSVVIRAAVSDFRWVCGNVELDYDKGAAREIIAIASFDEPRSKVFGYARFFQLEYKDGSLSDTFIQVDLKLHSANTVYHSTLGTNINAVSSVEARQTSADHNWAVFVNQVGEDAYITADGVRCIAAGFKWNPYLSKDNSEIYSASVCTRTELDGCAMGDLGQRHGPLVLGPDSRRTISDPNLPLTGNYSVLGRSLVIFDNKRPNVKLACANILPDVHLKSNVVIKQIPSFTVARFIEQMRSLLDATEWLMVPELRATKSVANGECVQMTIHFYGQRAHQMQIELNNLITLGTVRRSTRTGVDKITTHYRMCRLGQSQLAISGSLSVVTLTHNFIFYLEILTQVYVVVARCFYSPQIYMTFRG